MPPVTTDPKQIQAFFAPKDRFRVTVSGNASYLVAKPVWAAPFTHPNRYLGFLDAKDKEIAFISDPNELDTDSLEAVNEELRRRYLTTEVRSITHAKVEFGATYWNVETDRGHRDFVTQSLQENAQWLAENHLVLNDVDGNRFEIPDVTKLDARSRTYIEAIL
jgi:hypothetical protein